jgi:hypothetical protein
MTITTTMKMKRAIRMTAMKVLYFVFTWPLVSAWGFPSFISFSPDELVKPGFFITF